MDLETESEHQRLRRRVRELEEQLLLFRAILDNAPALISSKDLNGVVTSANRRFALLQGPQPEEFVGRSVFELFPPDVADALWRNDRLAALERRTIVAEEKVMHRDGRMRAYHTVKFPLVGADGKLRGTGAFSLDITEDKLAKERSITDELTGLYNRHHLNEWMAANGQMRFAPGRWRAMAMLDIDHFKDFNDHYGHLRGDEVLATVARTVRDAMRHPLDRAFRFGGEEFLLIYESSSYETVVNLAERVRLAVLGLRLPHGFNPPHGCITVSIGVCALEPDAKASCEALLDSADKALYRAKTGGRNTCAFAVLATDSD